MIQTSSRKRKKLSRNQSVIPQTAVAVIQKGQDESSDLVNDSNPNLEMMTTISSNEQTLDDIRNLTSSKVTDQLKVFLISQARNELSRIVKLTKFLDKLESRFMDKVDQAMEEDKLTLRQYNDVIGLITDLLARSNEIIYKVLKDDSLMTILNTTIYTTGGTTQMSSVISDLRDPQARERVRNVVQNILLTTKNYEVDQQGGIKQ